jgi:exosortase
MADPVRVPSRSWRPTVPVVLAALFGVALLWMYGPALREMVDRWRVDPRYSHGFLVPLFSAFLLWYRRDMLAQARLQPRWWGLLLVAAGLALDLGGVRYHFGWFEGASLMLALAGLCVLVGGWPVLRWAWPAIGFLFFMIPLPYRVERAVGQPLQWMATQASTYILQTIGLPAVAEGNIVLLKDDIRVNVAEACNGLGMLMMFFAYASAAALIIDRPMLDRVLILLSAAPIAVLANILRISATGLLYVTAGSEWAQAVYHDLAGWLMMPLALGILWFELWLLARLLPEELPEEAPLRPMDLHPQLPRRPAPA